MRRVAREVCKVNQEREFSKKMASRELQRCRFCCEKVHRGGKTWVGPLVLSLCAPSSLSSWRRERHLNSTSPCALGRLRAVQGTADLWAEVSVAVMKVNRVKRDCVTGLAIPVINLSRWLTPASCVGCEFSVNIVISVPTLLQKSSGRRPTRPCPHSTPVTTARGSACPTFPCLNPPCPACCTRTFRHSRNYSRRRMSPRAARRLQRPPRGGPPPSRGRPTRCRTPRRSASKTYGTFDLLGKAAVQCARRRRHGRRPGGG